MSITKSVLLQPYLLGGSAERLLLAACSRKDRAAAGIPPLAHWMRVWNHLQLPKHQNPPDMSWRAAMFFNTGVLKLHHPRIPVTNPEGFCLWKGLFST